MLKNYYSDRLEGSLYDGYLRMDDAVRNYRNDCVLYGIDQQGLERILAAYACENADAYFCALQFVRGQGTPRGVALQLHYYDCDEARFNQCFDEILAELDKKINSYTTDYEVAKLAYDYLAETVSSADEAQNTFLQIDQNDAAALESFVHEYGHAFCAYGAIVEKKAVCMGIAMAYKMLLDHYRVEVACVKGMYGEVPHMVNVVELDGVRSYVDITKGLADPNMPMVRYDMFLVSSERIHTYFTPDEDFDCVDGEQDYFRRNRLLFGDASSLRRYLSSCSYRRVGGQFRFRYSGSKLDDDALQKMLGEILSERCGTEYEIVGYVVENGVGNCLMKKMED